MLSSATMLNEMHAQRLRAAGYTTPVSVAFLHGWGDDSTAISEQLKVSGLFRVHDLQMRGSSMWAMYKTRDGLYGFLGVLVYLYFLYRAHTLLLLFPLVYLGFKHFERKTIYQVVDKDIAAAMDSFRDESPSLVIGHHYGGGLATYMLQHQLWRGPTALLAPAGNMLSTSMGDKLPTLASLTNTEQCIEESSGRSIPRPVLILHGRKDSKIDPADSYLLAASHAGDNCRLLLCSEDDHRLRTICRGNMFTGMLVDLLCGIVGTMDDPVSGKPSHAGMLKEHAIQGGGEPPFVELTGAHLAMTATGIY